jgi:hypothetical protein
MNAGRGVIAYFDDNTAAEWQVMRTEFKKTLDKFQVPAREQQELIAIVESTKKDIGIGAAPQQ